MKNPNIHKFQRPTSQTMARAGSDWRGSVTRAAAIAVVGLAASLAPRAAFAVDATVWTELAKTHELTASFTQVQHRAVLKAPLTSTGSVHFSRPQELDWVVESPSKSSFTLKNSIATMAYPELGMKETIDLASVPDANRLATSLLVWMQADASAVDRDFTVTYSESGARLVPRDGQLKKLLASIDLTLAASPWRVTSVKLSEPSGDTVDIAFSNVVLK